MWERRYGEGERYAEEREIKRNIKKKTNEREGEREREKERTKKRERNKQTNKQREREREREREVLTSSLVHVSDIRSHTLITPFSSADMSSP